MEEADYCMSNRWLSVLTVDTSKVGVSNLDIINELDKCNVEARPVWKPMHMQPYYSKYEYVKSNEIDVSQNLYKSGLCLPSGSSLSEAQQDLVIEIILNLIDS